jgi:ubiquinone/menaquinone biosynthesis C-methylase UbiE
VEGEAVLEMGVGTGKNLPCHPRGRRVTALDISNKMAERARRRRARLEARVHLEVADVQSLPHQGGHFDTAVASFLFCSVPDPVQGLKEARRVLKSGGRLLLLEHVLSRGSGLRPLMRWLDPLSAHIWGAHIDRETVANVHKAGFEDVDAQDRLLDVVKIITARAP